MSLFLDTLNQYLQLGIGIFSDHLTIKTKYGAIFVAGMPIIICVVICYAWAYKNGAWERKGKGRPAYMRSMSIGLLHGGHLALQRLVDYHEAQAELDKTEKKLEKLLADHHLHFRQLESTVAKLEMSRKEAAAVKALKSAMEKAQREGKAHEEYEIGMLLVEMLIYKGDWNEALSYKCLKDEKISDARRPLYKAIIYILLGECEEAESCWEEFNMIRENFLLCPNSESLQQYEAINDFSEFEKLVKLLIS